MSSSRKSRKSIFNQSDSGSSARIPSFVPPKGKAGSDGGADRALLLSLMPEDARIAEEAKETNRLEKEQAKRKAGRIKDEIERIEYIKFPTILGWYFDGYFTRNFTLNEEYVEYFNEIEQQLEAEKDYEIAETFTEKAFRNFWPPKHCGRFFRTRGVYLDLKEVREDPPGTPPDMSFERQRAVIGISLDDGLDDETRIKLGNVDYQSVSGRRGSDKRELYYWSDDTREYILKDENEEYEWWDEDQVWRIASGIGRNPYSWAWNPKEGKFSIRDKGRSYEYIFDQSLNLYVRKGLVGPSKNGMDPYDYYYSEITNKWIPKLLAPEGEEPSVYYMNGKRNIILGPRGKTGNGPDDYYYSGETGELEIKGENPMEYYYDTFDEMFKKIGEPYGPGSSGLYPRDFKFLTAEGTWVPKRPEELYQPSPYDWYFDMEKGKFFPRDKTQRDNYVFDQVANVWKLKGVKGPSTNNLGPDDYIYDEQSRAWIIENALDGEQIESHEPGKRRIRKGIRGSSEKTDDDYYYDGEEGDFILKQADRLKDYYYDSHEEVFRKHGQPYGPGKSKLHQKNYYFDQMEGLWLPSSDARAILGRNDYIESLITQHNASTPYDYAYNPRDGTFALREFNNERGYEYSKDDAVFVQKGIRGPSTNGKTVKDYYFDEVEGSWLLLESPDGPEAVDYKNGKRNNRTGLRGTSGKIPDDFVFTNGEFKDKDSSTDYVYDDKKGIWKVPNEVEAAGGPKSDDYFFSYEEGAFFKKTELKYGEIILDKNTHLWIQKFRIPDDYSWNGKAYALRSVRRNGVPRPKIVKVRSAKDVARDKKRKERLAKLKHEQEHDYDKPWLNNYMHLAATRPRFENEAIKAKKKRKVANSKKKGNPGQAPSQAPSQATTSVAPESVNSEVKKKKKRKVKVNSQPKIAPPSDLTMSEA